MMYKDIKDPNPQTRTRALRKLWRVKVFESNPHTKSGRVKKKLPKIREETVIAWNIVDANRKVAGDLVEQPEMIGFVTWPRQGEDHVYLIENTTEGPIEDEEIKPTVGGVGEDEDDWDF